MRKHYSYSSRASPAGENAETLKRRKLKDGNYSFEQYGVHYFGAWEKMQESLLKKSQDSTPMSDGLIFFVQRIGIAIPSAENAANYLDTFPVL